ncbi:MAG: hypothetical protein QOE93_693, partial [Actinomycetota bacterium]|nr:hypothetical protein [Actinomycetota bacterium]
LRLASGGSGILQAGRPHPDLVNRLAREARDTARLFFDRCVGAFTYLPPIDVTFPDFLRALVTADRIASPEDDSFRTAIIEAFRRRGIYAGDAGSLSDQAVALPSGGIDEELPRVISDLWDLTARARGEFVPESAEELALRGRIFPALARWAKKNAGELGLEPHDAEKCPISVRHANSTVRIDVDGQPQVVTVVQVVQKRLDLVDEEPGLGGIIPKAGATVVVDATGEVRYVIRKSLPAKAKTDHPRLAELVSTVAHFDRTDPRAAYLPAPDNRMLVNFALLHGNYTPAEDE